MTGLIKTGVLISAIETTKDRVFGNSGFLALAALIIAGEAIFLLPFVLSRIFRPTFIDIFGITNLQLGTAFSLYGVIAMVSYFAGGPLADRFSARTLLVAALLATSLGGAVMAAIPPIGVLTLLYGFWGLTTILLVWLFVPPTPRTDTLAGTRVSWRCLRQVMAMRTVWCQSVIVLCAYVAYKSTDGFSLYARDAFGYDEVEAATIGTVSFWMRPVAAIGAGLLADRFSGAIMLLWSFAVVMLGSGAIAAGLIVP